MKTDLVRQRIVLLAPFPMPRYGREGWERFVDLSGVGSFEEFDARFERVAFLPEPPFRMKEARAKAFRVTPSLRNRFVFFVGREIGTAFGVIKFPWCKLLNHKPGSFLAAVVPHPAQSGAFWLDVQNFIRIRTFFDSAANGYLYNLRATAGRMARIFIEKTLEKERGTPCGDST